MYVLKGSVNMLQATDTWLWIDSSETDKDIGQMIKNHCAAKRIILMYFKVIRYRAVKDIVGCKIVIPQNQEYVTLDPSSWPDKITVRRWESNEKWYGSDWHGRRENGYGYGRREDYSNERGDWTN